MALACFSCRVRKVGNEPVFGIYETIERHQKQIPGSIHTLTLGHDSTFLFVNKLDKVSPQCKGKWKVAGGNIILLECEEITYSYEVLSTNYMAQRKYQIYILQQDKLKYNNIILARKKK